MMHGSWDMKHDGQNIFVILDCFLPFYPPPNNQKSQNFAKLKKTSGNITILHKCTKNHDYILYCSLDMAHNRFNWYFSFWAIFCAFTSQQPKKSKLKKKWKKHLVSSLYTNVPKIMYICYTGPEIWCVTDVIIFHFGSLFALLPP